MHRMLAENLNAKHTLTGAESLPLTSFCDGASDTDGLSVPVRFLAVCRLRRPGLSALLDSDSRDERENLLTTHLGFLLRIPWVLEDQQRMDVALNTLHDGVQDRERLLARDRLQSGRSEEWLSLNHFRDVEIHLNRFTEPPVWAESVLQQLHLLVKDPLLLGSGGGGGLWGVSGGGRGMQQSLRDNNLYRSELSVLYQGEAGMGPGPIKELLEM